MPTHKYRVVIVGGGFGGVKAALELANDQRFEVTLVSDQTDLRYYPTLFQTATGGKRSNSSIPLKVILHDTDVNLVHDTAVSVDKQKRILTTESGSYPFDSLILALGVVTNYFNIPGLDKYSFSIKTQDEAMRFKAHLHEQLAAEHRPDLNYIIVGAGPTGIELAGSLGPYLRRVMRCHCLEPRKIHIDLVEAAPKLLPRLPKASSRIVARQLSRLAVSVKVNSLVEGETADSLMINGHAIQSHTVIWTAGVTNHPFFSANKFSLMNHGKVAVDVYLRAEDGIYVIGDNANTPYSGLAQTALRDGKFVAMNLKRQLDGHDLRAYKPVKPITVIPAGPHWAAVVYGRLHIYGRLGWLTRMAADFIGFHDLEAWDLAAKQWLNEFGSQEDCPVCATNGNKTSPKLA